MTAPLALRDAKDRGRTWSSLATPLAVTLLVAISAFFSVSPLLGLGGGRPVPAALRLSPLYIALAPWCDLLDSLTLMSVRQHVAFLGTLLGVYALWRSISWNQETSSLRVASCLSGVTPNYATGPRLSRELSASAAFVAMLVATYAVGSLLPRPMASLRLLTPDAIAVDFHSHTRASWDGRRSFSSERNRSWHRAAGYDAVYISDHGTLAGVIEGETRNPAIAGEGTVILPAVEVRCEGHHVVILGATIHEGTPDCASATVPASSIAESPGRWKTGGMITLVTIPARFALDRSIPRSQAIEIADAAPRALDQMQRDGALIRRIARTEDLALVASSNNHGWGRTAAAWSILEIDHWRSLTPRELDAAIRARLGSLRGKAVYVVERRRVTPASSTLALVGTVPAVAWRLLTTISPAERFSWVIWNWILWVLLRTMPRISGSRRPYLTVGT